MVSFGQGKNFDVTLPVGGRRKKDSVDGSGRCIVGHCENKMKGVRPNQKDPKEI